MSSAYVLTSPTYMPMILSYLAIIPTAVCKAFKNYLVDGYIGQLDTIEPRKQNRAAQAVITGATRMQSDGYSAARIRHMYNCNTIIGVATSLGNLALTAQGCDIDVFYAFENLRMFDMLKQALGPELKPLNQSGMNVSAMYVTPAIRVAKRKAWYKEDRKRIYLYQAVAIIYNSMNNRMLRAHPCHQYICLTAAARNYPAVVINTFIERNSHHLFDTDKCELLPMITCYRASGRTGVELTKYVVSEYNVKTHLGDLHLWRLYCGVYTKSAADIGRMVFGKDNVQHAVHMVYVLTMTAGLTMVSLADAVDYYRSIKSIKRLGEFDLAKQCGVVGKMMSDEAAMKDLYWVTKDTWDWEAITVSICGGILNSNVNLRHNSARCIHFVKADIPPLIHARRIANDDGQAKRPKL